ncbi:MAG: hypothetical protein WBN90_07925, partial [Gammaproteobacteria bacterium]
MHTKSFLCQLCNFLTIVSFIALTGCFGTGDGKPSVPGLAQTAKGKVIFSNVSGISYESPTQEDVTDLDSEFIFFPGEMVTFTVGDIDTGILLGIVSGASRITAVELSGSNAATDPRAVRVLRFIMSLDSDLIYSNGITIANPQLANGVTLNFDAEDSVFEAQLENAVNAITEPDNPVISADAALGNFCYSYLFGGGEDEFGFPFEGCELGPDEQLLLNGSFEDPDAGEFGLPCSNSWECFNDVFTKSGDDFQAPVAADGEQVLQIFGPFARELGAGAGQSFTPVPFSEYTATVLAQNWADGDGIDDANIAIFQLIFSTDGVFDDEGVGETSTEVVASGVIDPRGERTYLAPNVWTELSITATAPEGAVAARVVLLQIQLGEFGDAGGSIYYDKASAIGPTIEPPAVEYVQVWNDEFNGTELDFNNWTVELGDNDSGYGIWSYGDNNEWQKYTDSPDNIRIVFEDPNDINNGYLQIAALCGDPDNGIAATIAPK